MSARRRPRCSSGSCWRRCHLRAVVAGQYVVAAAVAASRPARGLRDRLRPARTSCAPPSRRWPHHRGDRRARARLGRELRPDPLVARALYLGRHRPCSLIIVGSGPARAVSAGDPAGLPGTAFSPVTEPSAAAPRPSQRALQLRSPRSPLASRWRCRAIGGGDGAERASRGSSRRRASAGAAHASAASTASFRLAARRRPWARSWTCSMVPPGDMQSRLGLQRTGSSATRSVSPAPVAAARPGLLAAGRRHARSPWLLALGGCSGLAHADVAARAT